MSQQQPEPLDEPVDVGDRYRWGEDADAEGVVEILGIWIDEDAVVQVRVEDAGDRRTVTADDVVDRIRAGELVDAEGGTQQ
jgi:hypothetical protein